MKIYGHRVGDGHFVSFGAHQFSHAGGERFGHGEPGRIAFEPAADRACLPLFQDLMKGPPGIAGKKAKGIPVQINLSLGDEEPLTKFRERIRLVQLSRGVCCSV